MVIPHAFARVVAGPGLGLEALKHQQIELPAHIGVFYVSCAACKI